MCEYCDNTENSYLKNIKITFEYDDLQAVSYPEIAHWETVLIMAVCPLCGRDYRKDKQEKTP
jgi:hypothetical protein